MPKHLRKYFISEIANFIASALDSNNRIILSANFSKCVIDKKLVNELKRVRN